LKKSETFFLKKQEKIKLYGENTFKTREKAYKLREKRAYWFCVSKRVLTICSSKWL